MKLQLRSLGEMLHRLRKLKRRTLIRVPRNLTGQLQATQATGLEQNSDCHLVIKNLNGKMWRVGPRITASLSRCGNCRLESRMR